MIHCQRGNWERCGEILNEFTQYKNLSLTSEEEAKVAAAILSDTSDPVTGNTPIIYVAISNKIEIMEQIVKLGGSLTKKNKENYSVLQFGKVSMLKVQRISN